MATEETKPASSNKLLPALLGLNSLVLAGVLALLLLRPGGAKGAAPASAEKSEHAAEKPSEHGEKSAKSEGEKSEHGSAEKSEHGSAEKSERGDKTPGGPTFKLPDFTVRLRNPEADRYARITFEVQVAADADKATIESHLPQVRDAFLSYLSDRTMEELRGSEGIEKTKQALLDKMPSVAPGAKVLAIFVTDMVVQ
jgi:flagellar FliL protein